MHPAVYIATARASGVSVLESSSTCGRYKQQGYSCSNYQVHVRAAASCALLLALMHNQLCNASILPTRCMCACYNGMLQCKEQHVAVLC
jgi:hypothetical protein